MFFKHERMWENKGNDRDWDHYLLGGSEQQRLNFQEVHLGWIRLCLSKSKKLSNQEDDKRLDRSHSHIASHIKRGIEVISQNCCQDLNTVCVKTTTYMRIWCCEDS